MAQRTIDVENLPDPLPSLVLVVGDEELLVGRAIGAIAAAARRADPESVQTELSAGALAGPELHELMGPSLFGDSRLVVLRAAQDVKPAALAELRPYLDVPGDGVTLVVQHAGGAKGKPVLDAIRAAAAAEIRCARLTRADERAEFVRAEVRRAGGRADADAVAAIVDSVGSDLRELAAVAGQLVSDSGGEVSEQVVRAYHRGRAEITGFAVADHAVVGNRVAALETLRHALVIGVPQVVIADALADGVRTVARVAAATGGRGSGDQYALAAQLAMPPWKVRRALSQSRGWSAAGLQRALGLVAELNADVKGAAADPNYALERAIGLLAAARAPSSATPTPG
jgi:DNA polymerase III subunit delta